MFLKRLVRQVGNLIFFQINWIILWCIHYWNFRIRRVWASLPRAKTQALGILNNARAALGKPGLTTTAYFAVTGSLRTSTKRQTTQTPRAAHGKEEPCGMSVCTRRLRQLLPILTRVVSRCSAKCMPHHPIFFFFCVCSFVLFVFM